MHWLSGGLRVARSVGLVKAPLGNGTGFLVAPWRLMTNNPVLPTPDSAAAATVRFGYQEQENGDITGVSKVGLDPDRFFATSPDSLLDYTVVAVGALPGGTAPGEELGVLPLVGATGKVLEGEPVNIIQHPDGRPKEVAFRNNQLVKLRRRPLGLPAVMRNLVPPWKGGGKRPGPELGGAPVPWLNAFDVRDFVALVHPLDSVYGGVLRDERTHNPSDPHSIQDYLADPDVARPIGRVLAGRAPW